MNKFVKFFHKMFQITLPSVIIEKNMRATILLLDRRMMNIQCEK